MKKVYIAPQTEAIEILADKVLMASPQSQEFILPHGTGSGSTMG